MLWEYRDLASAYIEATCEWFIFRHTPYASAEVSTNAYLNIYHIHDVEGAWFVLANNACANTHCLKKVPDEVLTMAQLLAG